MKKLNAFLAGLERFTNRAWYTPLVAFLAFADLFILIVPTDALVISNAVLQPRRGVRITLLVSLGSAFGAFLLALGIEAWGETFIQFFHLSPQMSPSWGRFAEWLRDHQEIALFLTAAGPLPLQPPVALAGLAGVVPLKVFLWVGLGRLLKYGIYAWLSRHAPHLLSRLWGVKIEIKQMEEARASQFQKDRLS